MHRLPYHTPPLPYHTPSLPYHTTANNGRLLNIDISLGVLALGGLSLIYHVGQFVLAFDSFTVTY